MSPGETNKFLELLDLTYDMIGVGQAKIISQAAKLQWVKDMSAYPLDLLDAALTAHRQDPERGKFIPKPADIIYQIERRMPVAWLSADEVWPLLPKTESESAMMTQEMQQALAVAMPALSAGDDIAARIAFRAAYTRLTDRAKIERRMPQYILSRGTDFAGQVEAVCAGVRQGLLTTDHALKLIPGAKYEIAAAAGLPIQQMQSIAVGLHRLGTELRNLTMREVPK